MNSCSLLRSAGRSPHMYYLLLLLPRGLSPRLGLAIVDQLVHDRRRRDRSKAKTTRTARAEQWTDRPACFALQAQLEPPPEQEHGRRGIQLHKVISKFASHQELMDRGSRGQNKKANLDVAELEVRFRRLFDREDLQRPHQCCGLHAEGFAFAIPIQQKMKVGGVLAMGLHLDTGVGTTAIP